MKTIALILITGAAILAQTPPPATCAIVSPEAAKMEFDAASIKPAGPYAPSRGGFGTSGGPGTNDPGRITMPRTSLAGLLMTAYDLWTDQVQGPAWLNNMMDNGYTITATMPATTTKEQYCGMLRNLIATRFHLTFRRETQPRPGYELTVMPGGPKFKEYVPGQPSSDPYAGRGQDANGFPKMPPDQATGLSFTMRPDGVTKESFRNTMPIFMRSIESAIAQSSGGGIIGAPLPRVTDKTGLTGIYDIHFEYQGPRLNPNDTTTASPTLDEAPSVSTSLQQLGLKLQKVKDVPVEVLVIDHADQTPTEN